MKLMFTAVEINQRLYKISVILNGGYIWKKTILKEPAVYIHYVSK